MRAFSDGVYKLSTTKNRNDDVQVELVLQLDGGGNLPRFVMEFYNSYNLRRVTVAQQYFQQLRVLKDFDEKVSNSANSSIMNLFAEIVLTSELSLYLYYAFPEGRSCYRYSIYAQDQSGKGSYEDFKASG